MFIRFDTTHERDRHTDRQTPRDGIGRAYASHRAAKMHSFFRHGVCLYLVPFLKHSASKNVVTLKSGVVQGH